MNLLNKLQDLNFTRNQAKVYIALLQIGEGTALAVSKHAGLPKSTTFETLRLLNQKKIVSKTSRGSKNIFSVSNPYITTRIKNKIPIRLIYADMPVGYKHKEKQQEQLRQVRFEKSKDFKFGIQIKLFGGKYSAFISNEEMMGIIIESQKTFNTLKSIFEVHWKALEK